MPGLAGIATKVPHTTIERMLGEMVTCMKHEPFHAMCTHAEPDGSITVGTVCDSASFDETMPVWNPNRDIGLVLLGDCYIASANGATPDVPTDDTAAVLLRLYEKSGVDCILSLNGRFCGLIIDRRQHITILFNDRYGLGRIYYYESPDAFYFSSEAKSLLAVLPQLREINERSLAEFYSVGCVLQDRSLFRDVFLLPTASQWIIARNGSIERRRYFEPKAWEEQKPLDAANYRRALQEVFQQVAPRCLRGSSSVAMSLTGGLDSRMLLAWAPAAPGTLPCYTFAGPYRDCSDVRIARRLSSLSGQPHTTIPVEQDFFREFPSLSDRTVYLTDGTMDVSGAVELYVNRRAREISPVRLTGNYGSEILRSNVAFRPSRLNRALFNPEFCNLLDEAEQTYRTEAAMHRLSFIAFKQVAWHHYARLAVEQSQLIPRSPFLDNELVKLAYRAPCELATSPLPLLELIAAGNRSLASIPTDRALRHRGVPVFDRFARSWQEFTAKAEYAFDYGMPHRLARVDHRLSALHLERLFLGRHKFYHFRIWYKNQLREHLEAATRDSSTLLSCYRPGVYKRLVAAHLSGQGNYTLELHKFLSVQAVERLLIRR